MGSGLSTSAHSSSGYRYGYPSSEQEVAVCPWLGTSLTLPKTVRLDALFHIHSVLGTGMLGRVRLVQHKQTRQYFALKTMKKADVLTHSMVVHVEREREAFNHLSKLATPLPFLATCFGSVQTTHHIHLVLEYVPGGELRHRLDHAGGTLSPNAAKFYATELVVFVTSCHAKGLMYRDLKPENILLDARGHVRVVDLGFVRRVHDPHERCGSAVGTPQYLAPEQLTQPSDRRHYTRAVDYWALACVVFELVAGHTPFADKKNPQESPFEVYTRIVQGRIQWPRRIPPLLRDLLKQMLQPDLSKRLCDGDAIQRHAWFREVDWHEVERCEVAPPFRPPLLGAGDRTCFEEYADDDCEAFTSHSNGTAMAYASEFRNF